ncbi:uncharacterized protein LOC125075643 [Vanessa atalanta]|uniref:uncharacterized protein LOC125075643 n=1 Tax=Vanessa atalanta TaxID=42275 RepID=UPI001FCD7780|nr:uncharacterized protein LOC125075643 [Vanessa atalanta]
MANEDGIFNESTPPLTSEEGMNQRHQSISGNSATMALLANTFKDTMCEMMMQMSQENHAALTEMMKMFRSEESRSVRISDIYFPSFDPDKGIVNDVREWVDLITRTQQEYKLKDHEVRLKAAGVLKGRAQTWADDCLLRTTTWAEMKEDMLQTFEPESRYFSEVLKFRRYGINDAESIPEYISNVWKMFKRIVKPDPTDQDAVEFVIGSIKEDGLRTELLNAKCQSVPELIAIAKTMRCTYPPTQERLSSKRMKVDRDRSDQGMTCFVCGKRGHRARWCNQNAIKNGEDRLCVDYRELNTNTVRDNYPLPLISEQLDQLADAKYFTCLDMAAGFHQVPISEASIEKTAFVTPDGQYEYLTMPFGLTNALSVYQRAINKALGELRGKVALVYMDDVLIPSKTINEGIHKLKLVLGNLTKCGFCIHIVKCSFLKISIEYLGFIVANGKVRPSSSKVDALARTPPPTNVKQLRQFNGLALLDLELC